MPWDGPAREVLEAGAESYIQKPFTVAALSAVEHRSS
jgi:DNA-binding response OmpR family regulator